MKEYFKLDMPEDELVMFLNAIFKAKKNPGTPVKMIEGYITYNDKDDESNFIFKIPPEFVGQVSETLAHCVMDPTIEYECIVSKLTLVADKE